jgi:hypothetical protein
MVGRNFDGGCAHTGGELSLGIWGDRLITVGDQEPGRQRLPGRDTHDIPKGAPVQRLLDREHDPGLDRINIGCEVVDEVVLRDPGEALLVDVEMRQGGTHRSLLQQGANRLTLIQPEPRDVDQTDHVRRVRAESGHDLAAVGVAGDDGRAVLAGQHLAQPGNVSGQRGLRKLGRGYLVAVGLQALDDRAPARAVGPGAVDEDDIRSITHSGSFPDGGLEDRPSLSV